MFFANSEKVKRCFAILILAINIEIFNQNIFLRSDLTADGFGSSERLPEVPPKRLGG